ncbi:hypothetical protein ES705_48811 [subsurface metagenome]
MPRVGQELEEKGITLKIMEIVPYFSPTGKRMLLVGYRIIDGKFTSTLAHFFMKANADIRPEVEKVINFYKEQMDIIKGIPINV